MIAWIRAWPFPKQKLLDSPKLKEFADDNSKVDKNGGKFFKRVENTVRKGEIARYEQFLLFPLFFQKIYTEDMYKNKGLFVKRDCIMQHAVLSPFLPERGPFYLHRGMSNIYPYSFD